MNLSFENIEYSYPGISTPALQSVGGYIEQGKITAMIGRSGSGKSTLGMILKGLMSMKHGGVFLVDSGGVKTKLTDQELLMMVGWTPANPEIQLFANTVHDEIAFGPSNQGFAGDELEEKVKRAASMVGLDYELFKYRHPLFLSGGEKRLVALAGVVAMGFKWYILDEPSVGLDYRGCKSVSRLVSNLAESGSGVCWISHDIISLKNVAQNVIELKDGRVVNFRSTINFDWNVSLNRMGEGSSN